MTAPAPTRTITLELVDGYTECFADYGFRFDESDPFFPVWHDTEADLNDRTVLSESEACLAVYETSIENNICDRAMFTDRITADTDCWRGDNGTLVTREYIEALIEAMCTYDGNAVEMVLGRDLASFVHSPRVRLSIDTTRAVTVNVAASWGLGEFTAHLTPLTASAAQQMAETEGVTYLHRKDRLRLVGSSEEDRLSDDLLCDVSRSLY